VSAGIEKVQAASKTADSVVKENAKHITQISLEHSTSVGKVEDEHDTVSAQRLANFVSLTTKGVQVTSTQTDTMRATIADLDKVFVASAEDLTGKLNSTQDDIRTHVHTHSEALIVVEAETVKYVSQEITRDFEPLPSKKQVVYPTKYASTPAYSEVLADQAPVWTREEGLLTGALAPGKPVDYPGEKGPEDWSGILSTKAPELSAPQQQALDSAQEESDGETERLDDDAEVEAEVADGLGSTEAGDPEDEDDPYNPHDLGEELDDDVAS
jgi:hypothetical protein